ncbi:hypothetical protein GIB67_041640 [Kingdonia uniflora]|uniref:SWIM-type domain-containing protein n=1 Tax=Kingdonia uniflora TaxID=39325 RepID=A0A7J7MQG8_9MAGN|nr:hypothetical protein GIB67_041640 [Kingdonia uniflora]
MYERKLKARELDQNGLIPRAMKMIELLKAYSYHYRLEEFEKDQWLVLNDNGIRWLLNLEKHICTCNVWQITGLPCVHEVKVINQLKYQWVGVVAYVAIYNQAVNLIADSSEWGEPTRDIRPPPLLKPTGRPRTLRRREADEVNGVVRQPRRYSMGRGGAKAYRLNTEFRIPLARGRVRGRGRAKKPSQPSPPSTQPSQQSQQSSQQSQPSQSFQPSHSSGQHFRIPRQDPNARRDHGGYRVTQTSRGFTHWFDASGQGEPSNRVTNKAVPVRGPWRI